MILKIKERSVICFDLDDTLYNEIDYLKSAYREIAKYIIGEDWKFLYAKMFSLYRKKENVFNFLETNYAVAIEDLLNMYRIHNPILKPFEGVLPLLRAIKKGNAALCVITDGRSITQRNKLNALGISDYFDLVIISEEIGSEKPNEVNYKLVEKKYPNSNYTYIADNFKKDFITPNKRNWNSIGVIDNGLNIHNHCFDYQSEKNRPKNLVTSIDRIQIL